MDFNGERVVLVDPTVDDFAPVLAALSRLNEVYHRPTGDVYQHRIDIERRLWHLMQVYDTYLG